MKNTLATSNTRDFIAPYAVASGAGFKVGAQIAIANTAAAQGVSVAGDIRGAFGNLAKAAGQAWVAKTTILYWDDAAKAFTSTAAGNTKAGVAFADALAADVVGSVELIPTI